MKILTTRALWCALAVVCCQSVWAADVGCGVGKTVEVEEIAGGQSGTIAEVGATSPHVGWYRIVFSYNSPKGDWYDPRYVIVHPAGSTDRCVGEKEPVTAAPANTQGAVTPAPTVTPAAAPAAAGGGMAMDAKSSKRCPAGRRVVDRDNSAGVVAGELNGLCVVKLDNGKTGSYLQWMLAGEGEKSAVADGVAPGNYLCESKLAGSFPIKIVDGGAYQDRAGKAGTYQLDKASGAIKFKSGSLSEYNSKLLGPGKFGLSGSSTKFFNTVCNLKN